jgi:uncharacterized membrane protein
MINLSAGTLIDRPIRRVFDFVSAPENDFQWQYGTLAAARLSDAPASRGIFFRVIAHLLGRRNIGTFEVTEYEPNRKYKFKSLSGPLYSQTTYTFEMVEGSTKISISTRANIVNFFQMDERILERKMKKQLKENLAKLKNLLEVEQTPRVI